MAPKKVPLQHGSRAKWGVPKSERTTAGDDSGWHWWDRLRWDRWQSRQSQVDWQERGRWQHRGRGGWWRRRRGEGVGSDWRRSGRKGWLNRWRWRYGGRWGDLEGRSGEARGWRRVGGSRQLEGWSDGLSRWGVDGSGGSGRVRGRGGRESRSWSRLARSWQQQRSRDSSREQELYPRLRKETAVNRTGADRGNLYSGLNRGWGGPGRLVYEDADSVRKKDPRYRE